MNRPRLRLFGMSVAITITALMLCTLVRGADDVPAKDAPRSSAKPKNRAESLGAIFSNLGLAKGSVVADIGAGGGEDTWGFAKLVGETGTVFAEEIGAGEVESLKKQAKAKGLSQVQAVLGRVDDPSLTADSVDLAYMHYTYHHFTKPREMFRGIWRALKPGGYMVVVDKQRGTLRDWVPLETRGPKHSWSAETTVVRERGKRVLSSSPAPMITGTTRKTLCSSFNARQS